MNHSILLICILFLTAHVTLCMNPPLWPQKFMERFSAKISSLRTNGAYWYNSIQNVQRLDFANGNIQELCGAIISQNTSCTILTKQQTSYFIFPQKQLCCQQEGFPFRGRDWIDDFDFRGEEIINGEAFYSWLSRDKNIEYFEDQSAKRIPRREVYAEGRLQFDYLTNTYTEDFDDEGAFAVPGYCKQKCKNFNPTRKTTENYVHQ